MPTSVALLTGPAILADRITEIRARVVDPLPPDSVLLHIRPVAGASWRAWPMRPAGAYEYAASVPASALSEGPHDVVISAFRHDSALTFPGSVPRPPTAWDYTAGMPWTLDVVGPRTPLRLFDPAMDAARLAFTRLGDAGRRGLFRIAWSELTGRPVLHLALPVDSGGTAPADYTASLVVTDRVGARQETIEGAGAVRVRLRGLGPRQALQLTLMEDDGTSWSAPVRVDSAWTEIAVPLADFAASRGVMLPEGFPGEWNYWVGPADGRGGAGDRPRLSHLERVQLSLRAPRGEVPAPERYGVELEWVTLEFGAGAGTARESP